MAIAFLNPLQELHQQSGAEFQDWAEVPIVQTFGEPQAEYSAIRKAAGMIDLPQRGILELTGKDRLPFLNNLLTNQTWDKSTKSGLQSGVGVYAFMLNLRGRIVADMNVLEVSGERTLLEMDIRLVEPMRLVLEKYLFAEQVKIASRVGAMHEIALHGPGAGQVLATCAGQSYPLSPVIGGEGEMLRSASVKLFDEIDIIIWRDDPAAVPGFHLIVPSESAAKLWAELIHRFGALENNKRQLRPIGWAAFNATRIEAGRAILGIDFDSAPVASAAPGKRDESADGSGSGALPAETGMLDRAVSFTKGCYLGQEIVARMHARSQVARQITGIRMDGDALPIGGAEVFDEKSNAVGVVTSSTVSPLLSNAAICLTMVKKPHFTIGSKLSIPAEGAIHQGMVVKMPFI